MSYWWWPPPRDTQYPDWTRVPAGLLDEALRLRGLLAYAPLWPVACAALMGAGCGVGAGILLAGAGVIAVPTSWEFVAFLAGGALLGAAIGWPLAATVGKACQEHVAGVLATGLLAAVLGPDVRAQFSNLHSGRHEYWPAPDSETVRMRINAFRRHYGRCAAIRRLPAWPPGMQGLSILCWLVPIGLFIAVAASNEGGRSLPYRPMPWVTACLGYLGGHPALAVLACLVLAAVSCLAAGIAAALNVGVDAATADALEELGSAQVRPAGANSAAAPEAPDDAEVQTEAFDGIPSGWS